MDDDRILCSDCATRQPCHGPLRAYPERPRRCEYFEPRPGSADRRSGRERFPMLLAEAHEQRSQRQR